MNKKCRAYLAFVSMLFLLPLLADEQPSLVTIENQSEFLADFIEGGLKTSDEGAFIVDPQSEISDEEARLLLAKALVTQNKGGEAEALDHLAILLGKKYKLPSVTLEKGKIFLRLEQYALAQDNFFRSIRLNPKESDLLADLSRGVAELGYMQLSRKLFNEALQLSSSPTLLLDFASLMLSWGDFIRAEAIFKEAYKNRPSLSLGLMLASSWIAAERYEEAEALYLSWLYCNPFNLKLLAALTQVKLLQKDYPQALIYAQRLPSDRNYLFLKSDVFFHNKIIPNELLSYAEEPHADLGFLLSLAKSYQKSGHSHIASDLFRRVLQRRPSNIAAEYYQIPLALRLSHSFVDTLAHRLTNPKELDKWASLYLEDGVAWPALILLRRALMLDPSYYPARLGIARLLPVYFVYRESSKIYQSLLEEFPDNPRIMLEEARLASWEKKYGRSIAHYDALLAVSPSNTVLLREKARVALWGKKFRLSMRTYDKLSQVLSDTLGVSSETLREVALERKVKCLIWHKRPNHALSHLRELVVIAPGNNEALFDYGQTLQSVGLCAAAPSVYKKIVELTPLHNIAKIALERAKLLYCPSFKSIYSYWHEVGYGVLSDIRRHRLMAGGEYPLSCSTKVALYANAWLEHSHIVTATFHAYGPTIELSHYFSPWLQASASFTQKAYYHKPWKTLYLGRVAAGINLKDYCEVEMGFERGEMLPNYFAVIQGIQTSTPWIALKTNLTRRWRWEGTYFHTEYSDHNSLDFFLMYTSYQLTEHPKVLKFIAEGEYRNTAHRDRPIYVGTKLVDIIHPYWTPQHYFAGRLWLEFRHDYALLEFFESEKQFYDIKVMVGDDSENNFARAILLTWHNDFKERWSFELQGLIHRSIQWNAEGLWATLQYRF